MTFYADLHIHSKHSRASSKNSDLENLSLWAQMKGISVVGTGDFTHPAWFAEIKEKLVPAEPGLFRLRIDLEKEVQAQLGSLAGNPTRFMLQVEISTIYKKLEKTRKIHHLIYVPNLQAAEKFRTRLDRIGNINSDGRPILGLDSRHLLEITLESDRNSFLIPAHIWTPWFALLGSKSGFDSVQDCYEDLSSHIFALETGLSSDPPMNWRLSMLDRYCLVSNSDAHSPAKLGREACIFSCDMDYFSMLQALKTAEGYGGTLEFFPEEGKYHMDGHRKCNIRFSPVETKSHQGICPVCGGSLTVGVMNRVEELADREELVSQQERVPFQNLVPLTEILAEIIGKGPGSKTVQTEYQRLLRDIGPELILLGEVPVEELKHKGSSLLAEAISRMRKGDIKREAGYDGEYGKIHLLPKDASRG